MLQTIKAIVRQSSVMNPDISQMITNVIRREEIENEKKIHIVRMTLMTLTVTLITIARLAMGDEMQKRFLFIAPSAFFYLILSIFLWYRFIKRACPPVVSYVLASLDLVYVVIMLIGNSQISGPNRFEGALAAPGFLILFVLNALSGLRFNFKASLYYAFASTVIVFGLGTYDAYQGYFAFTQNALLETVFKATLVGGTALVSGYIGHRSRKLIVQAVKEQEEKRFIKGIFGRYATEEVVEDALRRGLKLGGEERDVTIFFCDIRDFTGLAEKLRPNEVVDLLNDYFAEMVSIISKNGGTLNKFVGDGILAIFGAPVSYGNDAERAVRTALEMLERLEEFNRKQAEKGGVELRIGVGINTGRAVVGNVGSTERMEYTAIGDAVNLASRLDELNKELGTSILISHDTYQQIEGIIHAKELQQMRVKGREERVRVYKVVGDKATQQ